jgi:hypothetical protein
MSAGIDKPPSVTFDGWPRIGHLVESAMAS